MDQSGFFSFDPNLYSNTEITSHGNNDGEDDTEFVDLSTSTARQDAQFLEWNLERQQINSLYSTSPHSGHNTVTSPPGDFMQGASPYLPTGGVSSSHNPQQQQYTPNPQPQQYTPNPQQQQYTPNPQQQYTPNPQSMYNMMPHEPQDSSIQPELTIIQKQYAQLQRMQQDIKQQQQEMLKKQKEASNSPDDEAEDDSSSRKRKRRKKLTTRVKKACLACRRSHISCDNQRPCSRCQKKGIPCIDADDPKATAYAFNNTTRSKEKADVYDLSSDDTQEQEQQHTSHHNVFNRSTPVATVQKNMVELMEWPSTSSEDSPLVSRDLRFEVQQLKTIVHKQQEMINLLMGQSKDTKKQQQESKKQYELLTLAMNQLSIQSQELTQLKSTLHLTPRIESTQWHSVPDGPWNTYANSPTVGVFVFQNDEHQTLLGFNKSMVEWKELDFIDLKTNKYSWFKICEKHILPRPIMCLVRSGNEHIYFDFNVIAKASGKRGQVRVQIHVSDHIWWIGIDYGLIGKPQLVVCEEEQICPLKKKEIEKKELEEGCAQFATDGKRQDTFSHQMNVLLSTHGSNNSEQDKNNSK